MLFRATDSPILELRAIGLPYKQGKGTSGVLQVEASKLEFGFLITYPDIVNLLKVL